MNRRHLAASAIALSAALFAAPLAASADPVSTVTGISGGVTSIGNTISVTGSQCLVDDETTYVGIFYSADGESWYKNPVEAATDDGTWQWDFDLDPGTDVSSIVSVMYCSTAPVESLSDPAIQWASPEYTLTIDSGAKSVHGKARSGSAAKARGAKTAPTGGPDMVLNIDDKPLIDKMGIPGAQAGTLKSSVDANYAKVAQINRIYKAYFGRYADAAGLASWMKALNTGTTPAAIYQKFNTTAEAKATFVPLSNQAFTDRIYMNLFGHKADAATNAYWTAQMRAGMLRYTVINLIGEQADANAASAYASYVTASQFSLGKPVTDVAKTDALAAPLAAHHVSKVELVEQIAVS